jgi:3-hydroxyisobutyrate dehydrogenase-like beta-hydroxyacid dehydrogenase
MKDLAALCEERGKRFIDAPVVWGVGRREGPCLSLCGGSEEDVERQTGSDGL